ncbi:hypothetical protein HPB50_009476 [Hyalomma asiaticum]|uniref:Uncharacterized protein n=1 Tax=Hyalomma asiaticum TaxID=266040 RepID=A0ACB7T9B2_HYAAI|nr:hypothetical protein HPB50_009476 [Hyalomma asiaticum]
MVSVTAEWNSALVVVAVVVVSLVSLWRWRRNKFNFFKERGIPGPEPSLISGNFFQLWNRDTIKVLDEWSNKYGDIYGMFNGDAPFLMVKDLELLRRVFIKDFAMFVDRGDVWALMNARPEQRNSVSFAKSDRWKFIRRFISMAFTSAKLRPMVASMNKSVDNCLDLLETRCREAPDGQANAYPLLGCLAFELVAETACGLYLDVQNKPNDQYFSSAKTYVLNVVESFYQRAGQFLTGVRSLVALTCVLERHFGDEPLVALCHKAEPIVAFREKDPSLARPDMLQSLLEAKVPEELLVRSEFRERTNDEGEFLMPVKAIACNAASILTAGFETVSANSSSCVFCLARYLEIQEKVRQEVNAAYEKHGGFTYDAISDLPYTTQVIFETLRLYSPVVAFSPEQKASRDPLAFQPYGIGPRNCVGMKLAQLEMTLIVAKLVHRFRLRLGSKHENGELKMHTHSIIASPKNGVWLTVEKIR